MITHLTGNDFYHVEHEGKTLRFYLLEAQGSLELIGFSTYRSGSYVAFGPAAVGCTVEAIREAVHYADRWLEREGWKPLDNEEEF